MYIRTLKCDVVKHSTVVDTEGRTTAGRGREEEEEGERRDGEEMKK